MLVKPLSLLLFAGLVACASPGAVAPGTPAHEVRKLLGTPTVRDGGQWDYPREPYAYYRVLFSPDGRVREVRNLFTEENFGRIQPGMAADEVAAVAGVPSSYGGKQQYADGTRSWTYRYHDLGIAKLQHVIFDRAGRVLWQYAEWDPSVYSKGDGGVRR